MNKLFYRPADAWVGDNIPCYSNGKFYLYYRADRRIPVPFPKGEPFGWSLAVSDDLISFSDYGEVLHKGEKGGREHCIFAGSVTAITLAIPAETILSVGTYTASTFPTKLCTTCCISLGFVIVASI